MKHILYLSTFLLIGILNLQCSLGSGVEMGSLKFKSHKKPKKKTRPLNLNLPDADVYYQGWVKYYHYGNSTHYTKPPSLFQNNLFFHQRIPKDMLDKKDSYGSVHIPNKAAFFMVVYNNTIIMFSTRENQFNHMVDSLLIRHIRAIPEDDVLHGGVQDDGNFAFGYCVEIIADVPVTYSAKKVEGAGNPETWIICTNKPRQKDIILSLLIKLKVKEQRMLNGGRKITSMDKKSIDSLKPGIGGMIAHPTGERKGGSAHSQGDGVVDGYWVLLQDWTSCSQKCGNGTSYQQWMCVPPRNGGKSCEGPSLKTKTCNIHPCPSVNSLLSLINKNKHNVGKDKSLAPKPIVKAGVFSNRPQRYEKCRIKENDAFIMTTVVGSEQKVRKPMRLVMNNSTITIYNDDSYKDMHYSFDITKCKIILKPKERCCFDLSDHWQKETICGYSEYCGAPEKNTWAEGWNDDLNLFKGVCHNGFHSMNSLSMLDAKDISDLNKKNGNLMGEILAEVNYIILYLGRCICITKPSNLS